MLQRIQTVYFALAAICIGLTLAFPFATYSVPDGDVVFNAFGITSNSAKSVDPSVFFPYAIELVVSFGIIVFTIFQFKKRTNQLKINRLNFVLLIVLLAFLFYDLSSVRDQLGIEEAGVSYGVGFMLPIAALPMLFLANRAIKKDEALVKSLDRLR